MGAERRSERCADVLAGVREARRLTEERYAAECQLERELGYLPCPDWCTSDDLPGDSNYLLHSWRVGIGSAIDLDEYPARAVAVRIHHGVLDGWEVELSELVYPDGRYVASGPERMYRVRAKAAVR